MKKEFEKNVLELMRVMAKLGLEQITICPRDFNFTLLAEVPTVKTHDNETLRFYKTFKPEKVSVINTDIDMSYYEVSFDTFEWQGLAFGEYGDKMDKLIKENEGEEI